jgi:prepilin-type processing-associated H-X9-DG protein
VNGYNNMHSVAPPFTPTPAATGDYPFVTPAANGKSLGYFSYAMNSSLNSSRPRLKMANLKAAATTVLMIEKRMHVGEVPQALSARYDVAAGTTNRLPTRTLGRIKGDFQRFAGRHRKGGYLLFADGHVAYFALSEVLTPSKTNAETPGGDFNRHDVIWDPFGPVKGN